MVGGCRRESPVAGFRAGLLAAASLDVFVGKREQRRRHFEGERPGGLEIDHGFVLGRLLEFGIEDEAPRNQI